MKANEFIKKHGWNAAKMLIERNRFDMVQIKSGFRRDLRRLVESHNLVELVGGLCEAKTRLEQAEKDFTLLISFRNKYNEICGVYDHVLSQAILDVESCQ